MARAPQVVAPLAATAFLTRAGRGPSGPRVASPLASAGRGPRCSHRLDRLPRAPRGRRLLLGRQRRDAEHLGARAPARGREDPRDEGLCEPDRRDVVDASSHHPDVLESLVDRCSRASGRPAERPSRCGSTTAVCSTRTRFSVPLTLISVRRRGSELGALLADDAHLFAIVLVGGNATAVTTRTLSAAHP